MTYVYTEDEQRIMDNVAYLAPHFEAMNDKRKAAEAPERLPLMGVLILMVGGAFGGIVGAALAVWVLL